MMLVGSTRWERLFPVLLLATAIGCGDGGPRAEVRGKVTFEQQPVEDLVPDNVEPGFMLYTEALTGGMDPYTYIPW